MASPLVLIVDDNRDAPNIMLAAHAVQEHRDRAAEVGADVFLAKPVLPDQLAQEICPVPKTDPPKKRDQRNRGTPGDGSVL